MSSYSRGAFRPSYENSSAQSRAQGEPGARCTRGLVCKLHKEIRTRAYRFSGGIRPSLRNGFTAYGALPGEPALLPPSPCGSRARFTWIDAQPHNLTPASGRQDHTTSPSASAPFVKGASTSTASHRAFRDDREPPLLSGETGGEKPLICPSAKAKYFFPEGWTGFLICPTGKNCAQRVGRTGGPQTKFDFDLHQNGRRRLP
jgi:hypothetical protein